MVDLLNPRLMIYLSVPKYIHTKPPTYNTSPIGAVHAQYVEMQGSSILVIVCIDRIPKWTNLFRSPSMYILRQDSQNEHCAQGSHSISAAWYIRDSRSVQLVSFRTTLVSNYTSSQINWWDPVPPCSIRDFHTAEYRRISKPTFQKSQPHDPTTYGRLFTLRKYDMIVNQFSSI